jgi:hypothetical protein
VVGQNNIDSLAFESKIPRVIYLKMDIEGSEINPL